MTDFDDDYQQAAKDVGEQAIAIAETDPNALHCAEGEPVFYLEGPYAVAPGHIYSFAGIKEFQNPRSRLCEFHFDAFTAFEGDVPAAGWAILQEWRAANRVGDFIEKEENNG